MSETNWLALLENNARLISQIPQPTEEMMLLAVQQDGLLLQYIKEPTAVVCEAALRQNPKAIRFVKEPDEAMMLAAVRQSWLLLEYIKQPSPAVRRAALEQAGWAIRLLPDATEEEKQMAVRRHPDAIQYIKEPSVEVQLIAVKGDYVTLRDIACADRKVELLAVAKDAAAFLFIKQKTKEKCLDLLRVNIRIYQYMSELLSKEELEQLLIELVSLEAVPEGLIRDLLSFEMPAGSPWYEIDRVLLIRRYGSRKAQTVAVDEKLRL